MATLMKRLLSLFGSRERVAGNDLSPASRTGRSQNGHRDGRAATPPQGTTSLTNESYAERAATWADHAHLSPEEKQRQWEVHTDTWLQEIATNPHKLAEYFFLKRLLRQNGQSVATVAVSAKALYSVFMLEGRGKLEYFVQRISERNTPEEISRNLALIEDLAKIYGSESAQRILPLLSALTPGPSHCNNHSALQPPAVVLGIDTVTGREVRIPSAARPSGAFVIGETGVGKSHLLKSMILSDCAAGHSVIVFDPHGDLVRSVIAGLDAARLKDVLLLDVASEEPFGLNPVEPPEPRTLKNMAAAASFLAHAFSVLWGAGESTPRLMMVLRSVIRTLLENEEATLCEVPLLFSEATVRAKLMSTLTNSSIIDFWNDYNRRSERQQADLVDSTRNKITAFTDEPMIRHIFGQSRSTIDIRSAMDSGKIVLVSLNQQFEASRLLAVTMLAKILMAIFGRADTPSHLRRPCMLYADEWQTYISSDVAKLMAEQRKYNLCAHLANQTLEQIDPASRAAALQVGTLATFRVSGNDSRVLARSYDSTPAQELLAPTPDPIGHMMRNGSTNATVATFIAEYLSPLQALIRKVGHAIHPFQLGCTFANSDQVIEGHRLLNDCLAACMREGRSDVFIPPLALFVLGGAADDGITQVFADSLKHNIFGTIEFTGFYESANRFGRAGFLANQKNVDYLLKRHAWKRVWDDVFISRIVTPGPSFIAMLRSLRATMEVLATSPIMVDPHEFRSVRKPTSYTEQEHAIANEISLLENYHARVKILTSEHLITTLPPGPPIPEHEVEERIAAIKRRMLAEGSLRDAGEVAEEIAKRHERLRQRPQSDAPPPSSTTGRLPRRLRQKPPAAFT